MKKIITSVFVILLFSITIVMLLSNNAKTSVLITKTSTKLHSSFQSISPLALNNGLKIDTMRKQSYPGSAIISEQTLPDGSNYHQYIVSYKSQGLKIYGLLTVPFSQKPAGGFPVIVFNHGYIPPSTYITNPSVGQYATYLPVFAQDGYVVFKPDYRGNGDSEGKPEGAYYSPAYTTDDLNAVASIKKLTDPSMQKSSDVIVNPNKIGAWGHSMGGNITLRDLVVEPSWIKVAVIWGGVVGSSSDLLNWHDPHYKPSTYELALRNANKSHLLQVYGTPQTNPDFWNAIDSTYFVKDIQAPIQLHAGENDEEVPVSFSQELYDKLKKNGKITEFYTYPGADHNISQGFNDAMQRSLVFFDKYLK